MIKGIGIDTVNIDKIRKYITNEKLSSAFISHTFTSKEIASSQINSDKAEYFATRFAVKEAAFKAIAHNLDRKTFDMRHIECLNHNDGSPYININDHLKTIIKEASISILHVSITTEDNYATAIVIAE